MAVRTINFYGELEDFELEHPGYTILESDETANYPPTL